MKNSVLEQLKKYNSIKKADEKSIKKSLNMKEYSANIQNMKANIQTMKENIISPEKVFIPYDVNKLHAKGIKIIYNVYQSKYSNGKINGTGIGDFIRGCYFLIEFCKNNNFEPKIIFNNCISNFLKMKTEYDIESLQPLLSDINMFHNNNFKDSNIQNKYIFYPKLNLNCISDFVDYLYKLSVYSGNSFIYCNSYPTVENIPEKNKIYMREIMEPSDEIKSEVKERLQSMELNNKDYSVFHIRSGDDYLKNDNKLFKYNYLIELIREISSCIVSDENYLIIADNNEVKLLLKNVFPRMKILLREITHFGEGIELEEEKVKNSLIDFYMLSFSKKIISYTNYEHGSGFSYWCAKTYNIPYISKLIKSKK